MTPAGIGHNNGPTLEPGESWRRTAWSRARADLLPTLPIEVVRLRVRRAAELGLPYRTYAGIRASTGHDLIGFLFSSNALRLLRGADLPPDRAARLAAMIRTDRVALCHAPLRPADVAAQPGIDAALTAPRFEDSWGAVADRIVAAARSRGAAPDRFLVVGETAFERDWAEAGRTAGFVNGALLFG